MASAKPPENPAHGHAPKPPVILTVTQPETPSDNSFLHNPQTRPSKQSTFAEDESKKKGCWKCLGAIGERGEDTEFQIREIELPKWAVILRKFTMLWESLLVLMVMTTFFLTTYVAFFEVFDINLEWILLVLDLIYMADMMMRLLVEIWRFKSQQNVMIFASPYTLFQFILDLISIIPFDRLYLEISDPTSITEDLVHMSNLSFWRFNVFLRLSRPVVFAKTLAKQQTLNGHVLFMIQFTNYYIVFIHILACLLRYLVDVKPLDFLLHRNRSLLDKSWLRVVNEGKRGYPTEHAYQIYTISMNIATATITTVGYGDIVPTTEVEMVVCVLFMLLGAIIMNGIITSEFTSYHLETDGSRFDLFFRVAEIRKNLKTLQTLTIYIDKVVQYYNELWAYRQGVYDVQVFRRLPLTFQEDMLFDICQELFDKSQLFNGMDEGMLRSVAKKMKVALYSPEMVLCTKGRYTNKLYFILQGECVVMSKLRPHPAVILRAGSLIGEINLFYSFPSSATIQTRTCCQFLILGKEELFDCLKDFEDQLVIMRSRMQAKMAFLAQNYKVFGVPPICWVVAKKDHFNEAPRFKKLVRWGIGLNRKVKHDIINDTKDAVIIESLCEKRENAKNHLQAYMSSTIPEIMITLHPWVKYWNWFVMILAIIEATFGSYCATFQQLSDRERLLCSAVSTVAPFAVAIFMIDVYVEVIYAAPVYGWYYQFWDGLKIKLREIRFYFDILAALPIGITSGSGNQNWPKILGTIFRCLKLIKIYRYCKFVDNHFALNLFWFRLTQVLGMIVISMHLTACFSFYQACPEDENGTGYKCNNDSWLHSYQKNFELTEQDKAPRWMTMETLRDTSPYLYSFFYAGATVTSSGFGDFVPRRIDEMGWAMGCELLGFCLVAYCTSILASALSCTVRPKVIFQQRLIAIQQFMLHNELSDTLKDRVTEFYGLQNQLRGGVTLPKGAYNMMYDTPEYLHSDIIYIEVADLLEGIPIFSKVDTSVLIKMGGFLKAKLIPANTTFLRKGEIRRVMYLIGRGSMGVFMNDDEEPINILEASSHFGLRDLLFGEPCHFTIKTLSQVCVYTIKYQYVEDVMINEDDFWEHVEKERLKISASIEEMNTIYSKLVKIDKGTVDFASRAPNWVVIPKDPKKLDNASVYPEMDEKKIEKLIVKQARVNEEYEELFKMIRGGKFLRFFLMRRVVHPCGKFAVRWAAFMSILSMIYLVTLFAEVFTTFRNPPLRIFLWVIDIIHIMNIYINMHWGYYGASTKEGSQVLITHPLKTFLNYVRNGTFLHDLVACIPMEMLMPIVGWTNFWGYGEGSMWYTKLRWIRILHAKRVFVVFEIAHRIFSYRSMVLTTLYVFASLSICSLMGAICLYNACPWEQSVWHEGDEYRGPVCLERKILEEGPDYWATIKKLNQENYPAWDRWVLGVYYVSQVVLVVGFGDLITLRQTDILLLTFMQVAGFIFMRCVIADLTAAEVDTDEVRASFIAKMKSLELVMMRNNVPSRLMTTVKRHLINQGVTSSLQPKDLFTDLYPALESDLFWEWVGDQLSNVHLFQGLTGNVLRSIAGYLKKTYYLKGERIMRVGNMENELHIISKGKIYICDVNFNYLCTLSSGDCFGESSLIHHSRNRFNAIAMSNNVELYTLSLTSYDLLIERYLTLHEVFVERLGDGHRDYWEISLQTKMAMTRTLTQEQKLGLLRSFQTRRELIISALSLKETVEGTEKPTLCSKIIGYGSKDDDLPFIYFAKARTTSKRSFTILIHPDCEFFKWYNFLMSYVFYLSVAFATYIMAFFWERQPTEVVIYTIRIFESLFLAYMIIRFLTPFLIGKGVYCKNYTDIWLRYLTSPFGAWIDIVGLLPQFVFFVSNAEWWRMNQALMGFFKIVRLIRFFEYHIRRQSDLSITTFQYKLTLSVSSFGLMTHFLACIFYAISPCETSVDNLCRTPRDGARWTNEFVEEKELGDAPENYLEWKWYIRSIYWVIQTVSTTGYGDIVPFTVSEMFVSIVCIFCGAFVLSIILSNFTVGMASINRTWREYVYQVHVLVRHLGNIGLSKSKQTLSVQYFLRLWERYRGASDTVISSTLPTVLQIEVCNAMYGPLLKTIPHFQGHDEDSFIRQLSTRVTHSIFIPGLYIAKEWDAGSSMFVVMKGVVSATKIEQENLFDLDYMAKERVKRTSKSKTPDNDKKKVPEKLMKVYKPGDIFGHFPALFLDEVYKMSYRAESHVEVLEITQEIILLLSMKFPFFKRNMEHVLWTKYSRFGPGTPIFPFPDKPYGGSEMSLAEYNKLSSTTFVRQKSRIHRAASAESIMPSFRSASESSTSSAEVKNHIKNFQQHALITQADKDGKPGDSTKVIAGIVMENAGEEGKLSPQAELGLRASLAKDQQGGSGQQPKK